MPVIAHADHGPVSDIECGKQSRRSVALVVVSHRSATALLQGQARLGTVERLNLALFIYAHHDGVFRRIQIETDDIFQFLGEVFVLADLEALDQVRLQSVSMPDAPNGGLAYAHFSRHSPRAPVS